ncbi:claudin-4-like [Scyliorhinus torazame]|uniref:claudin-4-like n=1 Tax=Scyliorhinus torazame TaxID=75743 RepID=UPI003B5CAEC7
MASGGMQSLGILLGILGLIGTIVCCIVPKWKYNSHIGSSIVTAQTQEEGIWMNCVVQSTGQQQCKVYDSLMALSSDLQAARALTVITIIVSILGLLAALMGANFTTCLGDEDVKGKVATVAGVMLVVAGIMLLVPVSWSAHTTIRAFHNPLVTRKQEIGISVWVGWGAAALLLLGGGLLCCSWPRGSSGGSNYTAKYINNPSAPSRTHV